MSSFFYGSRITTERPPLGIHCAFCQPVEMSSPMASQFLETRGDDVEIPRQLDVLTTGSFGGLSSAHVAIVRPENFSNSDKLFRVARDIVP